MIFCHIIDELNLNSLELPPTIFIQNTEKMMLYAMIVIIFDYT